VPFQNPDDGAVTMFFRREVFDVAIQSLEDAGYRTHVVDASSSAVFRGEMTRVLRFKECFGYEPWTGNLDALSDAFREIDFESTIGVVLAFVRFDLLFAEDAHVARGVLDLIELRNVRGAGELLALVQSDDPRLEVGPIGARAPVWNDEEWSNAKRGP
jgi:hypothetical protein